MTTQCKPDYFAGVVSACGVTPAPTSSCATIVNFVNLMKSHVRLKVI